MYPLTESDIRTCFINASRREVTQAVLPELASVAWEDLDYLGWQDAKRPTLSYVVMPTQRGLVGVVLRPGASSSMVRTKAMCAWCEDVKETRNVGMFIAKRAGDAGRRGDTIGTLLCRDFRCSRNVRRMPTLTEMGGKVSDEERAYWQSQRIAKLQARAEGFMTKVATG